MTSSVSFSQPSTLIHFTPCEWVSDLCRCVYDFALKIINAIGNCFAAQQTAATTAVNPPLPPPTTTVLGSSMAANDADQQSLISFYRNGSANNNNVTLNQILNWDDGQLESVHNYIQWLFPLTTRSGPNPTAPVLTPATIQAFQIDVQLKINVFQSFRRMLTFYGLQMNETGNITRAPNFNARAAIWLTPSNHNFLRITRIIRSLSLLGLSHHSRAFSTIMQDIAHNEGAGAISSNTLAIWQNATPR